MGGDALDRVSDPEDYSQLRLAREIWEARRMFLEQRSKAYQHFWDNRIDRQDYLKAVRLGLENYLIQSRSTVRRHQYAQWFWAGEPPTVDGRSPYKRGEDGGLVADENDEPVLRAVRPDDEIEVGDGETMTAAEVRESGSYRLNRPILMTDDDGRLPFGTEPNELGSLDIPQQDRQILFYGLEAIREYPDPLEVEWEETEPHPQMIRRQAKRSAEYQLPEDVSMAAFELLNEFWEEHAGLGLKGSGLPKQTGMNLAEGMLGHVEGGRG